VTTASDWIAGGSVVVALASAVFAARNSSKATDVHQDEVEIERAKELRSDAAEARTDARKARTDAEHARSDAEQARRIAGEAHRRADEVVAYLGWILRLIHDPTMDIDTLRAQVRDSVPPVPVRNGAGPTPRGQQ
jgi:hypothetical protein